jgi:ABC-type nitrate/sulfonate/bicarbonate transport system permease component
MGAIGLSVLLSTSFKNYPASWKLAPSTVAIIMIPSISESVAWKDAMQISLARTGEVLYGTLVAFVLGVVLSFIRKKYFPKFGKEVIVKEEE